MKLCRPSAAPSYAATCVFASIHSSNRWRFTRTAVGENGPLTSLVIVPAITSAAPLQPAVSEPAQLALGVLVESSEPERATTAWKVGVESVYGNPVPDRTFMNWVAELLDAGLVERTRKGWYQAKGATATATQLPAAAIGKAA